MVLPAATEPDREPRRALLSDGTVVVLRRLGPEDRAAVDQLHRGLPLDDHYLRFFTGSRARVDAIADVIVEHRAVAVGAFGAAGLLGAAHYRPEPDGADPELAMVVAHDAQHHGVASLLLERLVDMARAEGVPRLTADVLAINHPMLRVIRDSGLPFSSIPDGDVRRLVLHLPPTTGSGPHTEHYVDAVLDRAAVADVASLRSVLAPRSVVVIGAGRRARSVGRLVLRRIVEGGFTGAVHAVNPHAGAVAGVPCRRSIAELPTGIDLAVLCVPAAVVPGVAEECGRRGVRALLVITAGVSTDPALAAGLSAAVERYGLRMVGPNCLGLVNTDPQVQLQANFGPLAAAGGVAVAAQSGGVAIALMAELNRLGLGVSTVVSTGDGVDVNGDDLLQWWAADGRTEAAVLYVDSLRRPRQFARLARRLARRMPVLTVRSGSSEAGRVAAASHSAGTATPRVVRDALFAQAGILAVDELTDLSALIALLCWQPLPGGPRVAVLSNAGGGGVLAVDACVRHGLAVAALSSQTRDALASSLPATAAVSNPIDTTATVDPATYGRVLDLLLRDPGVDTVVAIAVPTGAGDPLDGVFSVADRRPGKPIVAVRLGQGAGVLRLAPSQPGLVEPASADVPVFAEPAVAARTVRMAVRRAAWLRRTTEPARAPRGVDASQARAVVAAAMSARPAGDWLEPEQAVGLLGAAGVPLTPTSVVHTAEAAVRLWRAQGGAVAVKADVHGLVHKSSAGAVRTGLDSRRKIVDAVREFRSLFGSRLRGLVVQPMTEAGIELIIGVTGDPLFGPLLTLGLGGTTTDLVDDRGHCLVPATEDDLDDLLDGLRATPQLFGGRRSPGMRRTVREVAARMAWLAEQVPELAEAEINPLVIGTADATAVDVRIRLAPAVSSDPWQRVLPS